MSAPNVECWKEESSRYRNQESRPAGIERVCLASLTRDQQSVVLLDGLVTEFLESRHKEPIDVFCLYQSETPTPASTDVADDAVITRTSLLKGRHSCAVYAHATSHIFIRNIPAPFADDLRSGREGIGRLLLRYSVDCAREMRWFGIEPREQNLEAAGHLPGDRFLTRCYHMLSESRSIVTITERFPID
jgi:chorismate-pyruvate lyase